MEPLTLELRQTLLMDSKMLSPLMEPTMVPRAPVMAVTVMRLLTRIRNRQMMRTLLGMSPPMMMMSRKKGMMMTRKKRKKRTKSPTQYSH
ncbi:rCG19922 [Rattus norvegicus]|uniref:RCG19922 n=1 Tax=Rattus norvegicus TaxID=10116 RepID=A6MGT5_RAT|nr:rCG19922 [Rattus norvegicus]